MDFAQRAKSREGKLQVELAQLQYTMRVLWGKDCPYRVLVVVLERGPGETKLETDRRHIRSRIDEIKKQLAVVVEHRKDIVREEKIIKYFKFR